MDKFIERYRGASIFEVQIFKPEEGDPIGAKMIAKGMVPGSSNEKVDFVEDADTRDQALNKVKKEIDEYLATNNLDNFITPQSNQ